MTLSRLLRTTVAAALISGPLFAQDEITLTPQQTRALAVSLLDEGQLAEAAAIADVLLQRDPEDTSALIVRSQVAVASGDFAGAIELAGRAYRTSDNPDARFIAARLVARSHAELVQDTRAQIWLRRARQFAPNDAAAAAVAEDFQFLRRRNPWATNLRFGFTPSSNVNNGSAKSTSELFGLPFQLDGLARALSGYELSLGADSRYRLTANNVSATFLDFDINGRTYFLTDEAKEQAPGAKGSDFADATLGFGITHRRIFAEGLEPTTFSGRIGQYWYSGEPYTRSIDAKVSQSWRIDDNDSIGASLSAQNRRGLQGQELVRTYGLDLNWNHGFESGDLLQLSAGAARAESDDINSDFQSLSLGASYAFSQPVAGVQFGLGLSLNQRDWDAYTFAAGPREDKTAAVRLRMTFTQIEYYGFQPVMTLEATRTESNVDLFDRDYLRVGFDLQSSF